MNKKEIGIKEWINMDEAKVFGIVKNIVAEYLGVDEKNVSREVSFKDLGADSLDAAELLMALEDVFCIEVNSEDEDKLQTVGDAVEYIFKKKK